MRNVPVDELERKFGPCPETIHRWVALAALQQSSRRALEKILRLIGWGERLWRYRELIIGAHRKAVAWAQAHPWWIAAAASIGLAIAALRRYRLGNAALAR